MEPAANSLNNFHALIYHVDMVVVMFNKFLPSPHNLFHRRSFLGILLPTGLDDPPHPIGESYRLSIMRHLWSTPERDPEHYLFVLQSFERYLTGEDLDRKHRKGEYISRFRLHSRHPIPSGRVYDFWGQPSGSSDGSRSHSNNKARV